MASGKRDVWLDSACAAFKLQHVPSAKLDWQERSATPRKLSCHSSAPASISCDYWIIAERATWAAA